MTTAAQTAFLFTYGSPPPTFQKRQRSLPFLENGRGAPPPICLHPADGRVYAMHVITIVYTHTCICAFLPCRWHVACLAGDMWHAYCSLSSTIRLFLCARVACLCSCSALL